MKDQIITNITECPRCEWELDDDDGSFFDDLSGTKDCPNCGMEITYCKQLKRDVGNPYCDYVWHETFFEFEKISEDEAQNAT